MKETTKNSANETERKLLRMMHFNVSRHVKTSFFSKLAKKFKMWLRLKEIHGFRKYRKRDVVRDRCESAIAIDRAETDDPLYVPKDYQKKQ
ncbi:MAG: hypothetical protein LBI74_01940 [Synergistaceae bacterium]|nr:hypothetical protein [Synergistaceae bacterium]